VPNDGKIGSEQIDAVTAAKSSSEASPPTR
jgi:hypothetical protein